MPVKLRSLARGISRRTDLDLLSHLGETLFGGGLGLIGNIGIVGGSVLLRSHLVSATWWRAEWERSGREHGKGGKKSTLTLSIRQQRERDLSRAAPRGLEDVARLIPWLLRTHWGCGLPWFCCG